MSAPQPRPFLPLPPQMPSGFHIIYPLPSVIAIPASNNQYTLINTQFNLAAHLPLQKSFVTYSIPHANTAYTITRGALLSTPSDIRNTLTSPQYASNRSEYIAAALSVLGSTTEPVLRCVLNYLQTGRFNTALFAGKGGRYDIDFSISIIAHAILCGIPSVKGLAVLEMEREFFGKFIPSTAAPTPPGPGMGIGARMAARGMPRKLADLTVTQIMALATVGSDENVWYALFGWVCIVYRFPKEQKIESKQAVREVLQLKGDKRTVLNAAWTRYIAQAVELNGEEGEVWARGEFSALKDLLREDVTARDTSVEDASPEVRTTRSGTKGAVNREGRKG